MKRRLALAGFGALCVTAALAPLAPRARTGRDAAGSAAEAAASFPGWPAQFEGRALTALPLSELEQRFQQNFPGRVGRFSDGRREVILRWVAEGSRKLHSASDCFKANGHGVTPQPIHVAAGQRWSGFIAAKAGRRLLVRERIHDGAGAQWSDVSAWYWTAQLGRSTGPWWAVTVASTLEPEQNIAQPGSDPETETLHNRGLTPKVK